MQAHVHTLMNTALICWDIWGIIPGHLIYVASDSVINRLASCSSTFLSQDRIMLRDAN